MTGQNYLGQTGITNQQMLEYMIAFTEANSPLLKSCVPQTVPYGTGFGVVPMLDNVVVNATRGMVAQEVEDRNVVIPVNKIADVPLKFDSVKAKLMTPLQFAKVYLQEAAIKMAEHIERDIALELAKIPNVYLLQNPTSFSYGDITNALTALNDLGVTPNEATASLILHSGVIGSFIGLDRITGLSTAVQDKVRATGQLGSTLGYGTYQSNILPTHVAGNAPSMGIVANSPLNIAGSETVTISLTGTLRVGDVISFAGSTQQYNVQSTTSANGAGIMTVSIYPPLQKNIATGDGVLTFIRNGYTSVAMTNKCVGVCFAELPTLTEDEGFRTGMAEVRTENGISFRLYKTRDFAGDLLVTVTARYGIKLVNPSKALLIR